MDLSQSVIAICNLRFDLLTKQEASRSITYQNRLDWTPTLNSKNASVIAEAVSTAFIVQVETQVGLGNPKDAAGWDDFPNGRFGDYKSPAFGNQGPWGGPDITVSRRVHRAPLVLILTSCTVE